MTKKKKEVVEEEIKVPVVPDEPIVAVEEAQEEIAELDPESFLKFVVGAMTSVDTGDKLRIVRTQDIQDHEEGYSVIAFDFKFDSPDLEYAGFFKLDLTCKKKPKYF